VKLLPSSTSNRIWLGIASYFSLKISIVVWLSLYMHSYVDSIGISSYLTVFGLLGF
jgi:hypothetical protein